MSLFDKLDNYYHSRKPSEVWMMVALVSVLIGYLLYTLLEPISSNYRETQEDINQDLRTKIENAKSYIRSVTVNGDKNFYINDLNRKIVTKRMAINQLREKMSKLDGSLKEFKELLYTKDNWSKFLHDITLDAKKSGLKLYSISNHRYDQNDTFGKVLDVNIRTQGEYSRILEFMNSIEQTELVANISAVDLESTQTQPIADINLSVWGIKP
jgi:Tfp pilus assembly protein PilN